MVKKLDNNIMYLVLGGSPRYHIDDDKYDKVFGLFSSYKKACQCHAYNKPFTGDLLILPIEINKPLENCYLSDGEEDPPVPKTKHPLYKPYWVVKTNPRSSDESILYGVYTRRSSATKLQKELLKKEWMSCFDEKYPEVVKYIMMDVDKFEPNILEFMNKKIEPTVMIKTPHFSRGRS